jgi:type IV pilus assembly protein PilB
MLEGKPLFKLKTEDLKKLIVENNFATAKKVDEALKKAESEKKSLQNYLVESKIITEKDLVVLYGQANNIPFADLSSIDIQKEHLSQIPEKIAQRYMAVVFGEDEDGSLKLAMADPLDIQAVQFIEKELGYQTKLYIATTADIGNALDLYKEGISTEISKVIAETEGIMIEESELKENASAENVQEIVQEAPISKALNIILEYAIKSRASDVHIEPREAYVHVRFRVDGVLQDTMTLPKNVLSSLVTRIKILSNLRIDEHRVPQDGRIKIKLGPKIISIRVSTLPIVDGEKVVMRLLDETTQAPTLEELGFSGRALTCIKDSLQKPHGMLLVTGPTGSGKSTTLYSALSLLNSVKVNISTVEDPIEYRMPGVNQTQVNTKTGMSFASGLRALLRQDPDIIMIGEIRDTETAEMAVHAALTGHIVLSTLHTNNAAGCLPRLLDMDVEPFLIASTVNAVIGQRLVRKLCSECREIYKATREQIESIMTEFNLNRDFLVSGAKKDVVSAINKMSKENDAAGKDVLKSVESENNLSMIDLISHQPNIFSVPIKKVGTSNATTFRELIFLSQDEEQKKTNNNNDLSLMLYRAKGCSKCGNTGYNGRVGIYEVLEMTEEIGQMIVAHASTDTIDREARKNGMTTMSQDGFVKAIMGTTTIEEILRVTREQ